GRPVAGVPVRGGEGGGGDGRFVGGPGRRPRADVPDRVRWAVPAVEERTVRAGPGPGRGGRRPVHRRDPLPGGGRRPRGRVAGPGPVRLRRCAERGRTAAAQPVRPRGAGGPPQRRGPGPAAGGHDRVVRDEPARLRVAGLFAGGTGARDGTAPAGLGAPQVGSAAWTRSACSRW